MTGITVTGQGDIDQATAEIAVALRDAGYGKREQDCYDEAARLRDAVMAGTRALGAGVSVTHTGMAEHDGYAAHSHEVRPDHRGVRTLAAGPENYGYVPAAVADAEDRS